MTFKQTALLFGFCCVIGVQIQARAQEQRSPADSVNEVNQLFNDSGRADLSEQEAEKQRQRARQLAAQYAATLKASGPTGMDRIYLGYLYQLADDKENAVATFREALAGTSLIEERKQQAHLLLIRNLADLGRIEEAEAALGAIPSTAFNANETRADAHDRLAVAYTGREEMSKALRHEEQALGAARASGDIRRIWLMGRSLAQLYMALDRRAESVRLLEELKSFFVRQAEMVSPNAPNRRTIDTAVAQMEVALGQIGMIGKPAPELSVAKWIKEDAGTTLAGLRGKVVLLELWAAWCPDCRGLTPHLRHWRAQYAGQGLKILPVTQYYGYNGREVNKADPAQEEAFLLKYKQINNIPYGTGLDPEGAPTFKRYHVRSIPHIVVVDRAGIVRFVFTWHTNPALCEYVIKRVLAEPAATGS